MISHVDSAPATPFVRNGDFEEVTIGPPFYSLNPADVPGWTHAGSGEKPPGGSGLVYLWRVGYTDGGGTIVKAGHGKQFVTLGGGYEASGSASWSTTISRLAPGGLYQLSFMIANENIDRAPQTLTVSFPSGSSTPPQPITAQPATKYWSSWEAKTMTFLATATSATVKFSVTNLRYDIGLDYVQVNAAPKSLGSQVIEEQGRVRIVVPAAILFDFDRYNLKPAAEAALSEIKSSVIDRYPGAHLVIEGYTDDRGSQEYNVKLSAQRAQSVKRFYDRDWRAPENYHLCVNTDWLGIEGSAQMISRAARGVFPAVTPERFTPAYNLRISGDVEKA